MLEAHLTRLTHLAFQHRGELLASSDADGFLRVWNPRQSDKPIAMRVLQSAISRVAWSPDDRLLVVGQENGGIAGIVADPADRGQIK